ncbi:hypothetical protein K3495_g6351 [Podosphaera aphanis]|nr:hypothetical protein K3495_g6351 [Podosphaera aphanis]
MARAVRQPIDVVSLEAYLGRHMPALQSPITVQQFGYGQSNPTYLLTTRDQQRYVLRKKPPGALVSATAHQIEREYRVLRALALTPVPSPRVYGLCDDARVVGTPFYIMEYLDGRIFTDPALPDVAPAERRAMWEDAVRTLALLHAVRPAEVGLQTFGKSTGFYNRQIKTFGTICRAQAAVRDCETAVPVGAIPHLDDMLRYFADPPGQPAERSTLVHGDFKIDNLVFHPTAPKVMGILDWEMSTIGHPLSDLANLLAPYTLGTHDDRRVRLRAPTPLPAVFPAVTPGLPTPAELLALYTRATHWDPRPDLPWAIAFGFFRLTAICQGIAARHAMRQASSARAKDNAHARHRIAALAWKLVRENIAATTTTKRASCL